MSTYKRLDQVGPRSVNWPHLMTLAETVGVPVSRVDDLGRAHILRTLRQLRAEWVD